MKKVEKYLLSLLLLRLYQFKQLLPVKRVYASKDNAL